MIMKHLVPSRRDRGIGVIIDLMGGGDHHLRDSRGAIGHPEGDGLSSGVNVGSRVEEVVKPADDARRRDQGRKCGGGDEDLEDQCK